MSSSLIINEMVEEAHDRPERKKKLGVLFWICVGWLVLNFVGAIFANVLPLQNPLYQNYAVVNAAPSLHHLFGTDDLGRDIFARIVYGSRVSIEVSLGAMLIGFGIGAPLGMLAAYRRGKFDSILTAVMYVLLAFPAIIATIAVLSFWTPRSLLKIIIVVGVASIPLVYRVIRSATMNYSTRDFVVAAKVQGATDRRILVKELLPNVAPIGVSFLLIGIATVVTLEGALAFLGLSVNPPDALVGQHDQREPLDPPAEPLARHLSFPGHVSLPALFELHRRPTAIAL